MARTKRSRRNYGAGEWGRNRVRVFRDPKTGLFQVESRENGRRLTRSLGHRAWTRAKKQADEFAAGFASPDLNGNADAEPEPEPRWRCSSTSSAGTQGRRHSPSAIGIASSKGGEGRSVGQACGRPHGRVRPQVPDGGSELGREVEGRAGAAASSTGTCSRASQNPRRRTPPASFSPRTNTRRC